MPRTPKLRQKNGYWYTSTGDPNGRYFGKVGEVPYEIAERKFSRYVAECREVNLEACIPPISVDELVDDFLAWIKEHRPGPTHDTRKIHLNRWRDVHGLMRGASMNAKHLEEFLKTIPGLRYRKHHEISIRAMIRWGRKHRKLPESFSPFETVEPVRVPDKVLSEADLPTEEEIRLLLEYADADLAPINFKQRFRRRLPEEYRPDHPYKGFRDLLVCYLATGPRTSELLECLVRDFQPRSRVVVLGQHKRSRTLRTPVPRTITLDAEAYEVFARLCKGKRPDEYVFLNNGKPWHQHRVNARFSAIRERAGVRDSITPYSFRHYWITDAIEAGIDMGQIAKMAGTSVAMIEKHYGHFRTAQLHEVQGRIDALRAKRKGSQ